MALTTPTNTLALTAGARALQRIRLACGDVCLAFENLGTGLTPEAIWELCELSEEATNAEEALAVSIIAVEADRERSRLQRQAERAHLDADRRWRKDVAAGQLSLEGVEPTRYTPGESIGHWQELRLGVWIRAGGCCEDCGRDGKKLALDMHHVSYDRYGHEEPTDVVLLCRGCHDLRHSPRPPV